MEIIVTKQAQQDLREIKKYICSDNFSAAQRVVSHIVKSVERLELTPNIGKQGRVLRTRELVISKYPYIVSYKVENDEIYILRILHTSKKWKNQTSL